METFKEFSFEAAHSTTPFAGLHGHSFRARIVLTGRRDPVYGWSHNLFEVEQTLDAIRQRLDHKYLNDVEGLSVPTLENVALWLWSEVKQRLPGVDRVELSRGADGQAEGCICRGP